MQEAAENIAALMNSTDESVFIMDCDGAVIRSNETNARRVGKSPAEIEGRSIYYHDSHAGILQAFANQVAIAAHNATLYKEVHNLIAVDELTGLDNRRGFFEVSRREVGRLERFRRLFSVLFIDIDHFKQFNDRYSYEVGDKALRLVAENVQHNVREVDIVGRYGGGEVVVLLPEIGQKSVVEVVERLRTEIEDLRSSSDKEELKVTFNIGVAILAPKPEQTLTLDADRQEKILSLVIANAGQALHFAKQQGRNRVAVYAEE